MVEDYPQSIGMLCIQKLKEDSAVKSIGYPVHNAFNPSP